MEATTPLSAILWKEAQNDPNMLQGWHFEHLVGDPKKREPLGTDTKILDIQGTGGSRTLYLIQD